MPDAAPPRMLMGLKPIVPAFDVEGEGLVRRGIHQCFVGCGTKKCPAASKISGCANRRHMGAAVTFGEEG